jgi:beta-N-acetylhexosaminidase
VERLLAAGKTVVLCVFGNPYVISDFPRTAACLTTFSAQNPAVAAGVRVLFGEIPARGRLPVTIPGRYDFGYGLAGA